MDTDLNSELSSFQGLLSTHKAFGACKSVLFMVVSSIQGCPYRGVLFYCTNVLHCMYMYVHVAIVWSFCLGRDSCKAFSATASDVVPEGSRRRESTCQSPGCHWTDGTSPPFDSSRSCFQRTAQWSEGAALIAMSWCSLHLSPPPPHRKMRTQH